ncbi:MAG: iron-sulfur cluster repair di-iron protein [Ornithinimicrobium sp.]|uniref:iron-sulfur cluster repair di-iron protein n=1 Tax=Ornithinimicrobium sp. TaxID=1977084 RepID=UPI0026DF4404|nr:iron-sulfur cluster repair di-iron protein [Ornithinimicrobium sp.]MDO5739311.1 iron-sulfur cluster repair di-iron protein [Ornithinimicrobium sp.]
MTVDISASLGDLVTEDPRRSRVLEKLGIDYCCNGHRSLADATIEAGLNLTEVTDALSIPDPPPAQEGQGSRENATLAHDIVDTHHAYMWEEMPRLQALVEKVHTVHGDRHPELAQVHTTFTEAVTALDPHMTTEERVLFPAISKLEKTQASPTSGSFAPTIEQLRAEHDEVGRLFKEIRSLTGGYAVPEDGCNSYRMMMTGLQEMELDLHEHIHKENNILFPRALDLEKQIADS